MVGRLAGFCDGIFSGKKNVHFSRPSCYHQHILFSFHLEKTNLSLPARIFLGFWSQESSPMKGKYYHFWLQITPEISMVSSLGPYCHRHLHIPSVLHLRCLDLRRKQRKLLLTTPSPSTLRLIAGTFATKIPQPKLQIPTDSKAQKKKKQKHISNLCFA